MVLFFVELFVIRLKKEAVSFREAVINVTYGDDGKSTC
jgi:hypothetical protein